MELKWLDRKVTPPTHEEGKKIIAYGGYVFECESEDGIWCNMGGDDFTHWMPYFAPPYRVNHGGDSYISCKVFISSK